MQLKKDWITSSIGLFKTSKKAMCILPAVIFVTIITIACDARTRPEGGGNEWPNSVKGIRATEGTTNHADDGMAEGGANHAKDGGVENDVEPSKGDGIEGNRMNGYKGTWYQDFNT